MSTYNLNKYPSMGSVANQSTANLGYMPHSRAYLPLKTSPQKPYGPSFVNVMNRMWRGSGRKYVIYAVICLGTAILFFVGGALYFGHRNVSRMVVLNTEVLGALMIAAGILFTGAFFHFMYQANVASNRWRQNIRFRAEGLCSVAAYNKAYTPDEDKLATGTYGPTAIKELTRGRPNKSRSRGFSRGGFMSGAITPRTPLIYAEQDMSYRMAERGGDESMRSSMQWPSKPPGPPETETWPQPSRGQPTQRQAQDIQKQETYMSQDTEDGPSEVHRSQQLVYYPPSLATPSPPPPPPPPTALPPVNRQPVSSTKKPAAPSSHPAPAYQLQQQNPGQGQGAGRAALRLSYDGSESEL